MEEEKGEERASDMIRKIWVICSEGGGVEGIFFLSFRLCFSFFARGKTRQGKTRQDTVRFFSKSRNGNGKVYLHPPTCPYTYLLTCTFDDPEIYLSHI